MSAPPVYGAASAPPGQPPYYSQPAGYAYAQRQTPAFFTGDWVGAAIVNAVAFGAMAVLGLVAVLLLNSDRFGDVESSDLIGDVFRSVSFAVGADAEEGNSNRFLTLTLVGYGLLSFLFLKRLRQAGPVTQSGYAMQVGRVAIVHLAGLLLVSLMSRMGDSFLEIDVASALLFGMVTLAVALFVTTLIALPGLFPGKVEYYRGLLAGPLKAILFLIVASSALAFVGLIILAFADDSGADAGDTVEALLFYALTVLPNVAGFFLLLGIGVPVKAEGGVSVFGATEDATGSSRTASINIFDIADVESLFWLLPLLALGLLVLTGWYSAKHSPVGANGRPIGWWLTAALPTALFILALTAKPDSFPNSFPTLGSIRGAGSLGYDVLFVILLGAVFGFGAGMLGSVMVPQRPVVGPGYPMMGPVPPMPTPPPTVPAPPGFTAPTPGYQPPPGYTPPAPAPPVASAPPAAGQPPAQSGPPAPPAPPAEPRQSN